jgi:hypothetical protein
MLRAKCSLALDLANNKDFKCKSQCDRMEELMKYATKNNNDVKKLKEICDTQKVKISCLRGHRNELLDKIDVMEEQHESERKEKEKIICTIEE